MSQKLVTQIKGEIKQLQATFLGIGLEGMRWTVKYQHQDGSMTNIRAKTLEHIEGAMRHYRLSHIFKSKCEIEHVTLEKEAK